MTSHPVLRQTECRSSTVPYKVAVVFWPLFQSMAVSARHSRLSTAKYENRRGDHLQIDFSVTLFQRNLNELAHCKKPLNSRICRHAGSMQLGTSRPVRYQCRQWNGLDQHGSDHGPVQSSKPPRPTAFGLL